MTMTLDVAKSELGWEVTYDGIFAPEEETQVFATAAEARAACERIAADARAWDRSGLADAPHLDAF